MSILYRIYSNDGAGGPVDYSAPIATTAGLAFNPPGLVPSGDYRFAIRAFDDATGIEESNTQAVVRVRLDAGGRRIAEPPDPPHALVARPTAGGGCRVDWAYRAAGQAIPPSTFDVYLTPGATADLSTPVATVVYRPGVLGYTVDLTGLGDGVAYTVAVASRGAGGRGRSEAVATPIRGDSTPPDDVDGLSLTPIG